LRNITEDRLGMIGFITVSAIIFLAIFAPLLVPYGVAENVLRPDRTPAMLEPPSWRHWFGTTNLAEDVFSQTLWGGRVALMIGLVSGICVTVIGTNIGLIAGYYGRWVDDILMRLTDVAYGIPFLPFGIILVAILGASKWTIILTISVLMWRTTARVIRSQVLSLKERPFVMAARASGASDLRILYRHIAPNILPLAFLYTALSVGFGVIAEASLSFVGLGDPATISWGRMLYFAFWAGAMRTAWWWIIPPGLCIGLLVVSCYLIARGYEIVFNPKLKEF
jgi:peptide/nickel transport system permease protein